MDWFPVITFFVLLLALLCGYVVSAIFLGHYIAHRAIPDRSRLGERQEDALFNAGIAFGLAFAVVPIVIVWIIIMLFPPFSLNIVTIILLLIPVVLAIATIAAVVEAKRNIAIIKHELE